MSELPEVDREELGDIEVYEPEPCSLGELEVLIFDPIEFTELTNSIAAVARDGALFVLDRETLKWRNVEDLKKEQKKTGSGLRAIKKEDAKDV